MVVLACVEQRHSYHDKTRVLHNSTADSSALRRELGWETVLKVVAGFLTDDATAPNATGVWQSLEPTGHRCRALPHDERIPYWQEPTGNWQLSHMTSPVPCGAKVRHGALPDTSMSHQSIVLGGHTEWLYFSAFSKYVAAQYIMSTDKRPAIASIKSGSADRRARNLRPCDRFCAPRDQREYETACSSVVDARFAGLLFALRAPHVL